MLQKVGSSRKIYKVGLLVGPNSLLGMDPTATAAISLACKTAGFWGCSIFSGKRKQVNSKKIMLPFVKIIALRPQTTIGSIAYHHWLQVCNLMAGVFLSVLDEI